MHFYVKNEKRFSFLFHVFSNSMLNLTKKQFWIRALCVAILVVGCFLFARASIFLRQTPEKPMRFGVTYSTIYASYLGLDVMKTYRDLIDDLGVRAVRIPVYWSDLEREQGQFDWNQLDQLVKYSEEHQVKLTLALGRKVPRWPECFIPNWAEKLSQDDQQKAVLDMLGAVVRRYKNSPAIERWQLENEPFLPFGVCQQIREKDLQEEIGFVRALDTRPIQMTASGEMQPWGMTAQLSDVFGISVYRMTWNTVFGYFTYPLSPLFYRSRMAPLDGRGKQTIVSELQAEPWFPEDYKNQSASYWYSKFTAEDLAENVRFTKETSISEAYFWGVEWWAYLKEHGEDRLWNKAKEFFLMK